MSSLARRLGGLAGIAFVGLFVASLFVGGSDLGGPDFPAEVIAADLAERLDGLKVAGSLAGLAAIAGYWFIAEVAHRLGAEGPSTGRWLAIVGGTAMVTVVLAGSAVTRAAVTVDSLRSDPQVAKTLWLLELGAFDALLGPTLAAFAFGVSAHALTHAFPPRWVGWTGLLIGAVLIINTAPALGGLAALGMLWVAVLAAVMVVLVPEGDQGSADLDS